MASSSSTTRMWRRWAGAPASDDVPGAGAAAAAWPEATIGSSIEKVVPLPDAALRPDAAAVLLDDAIADGEAEAGALAGVLRGEEGIEDAADGGFVHAGAGVGERRDDGAAGAAGGGDAQGACAAFVAAGTHGLLGVDDEVEEDLQELVRVDHRVGQVGIEFLHYVDVADAQIVVAEFEHALDQGVDVRGLLSGVAAAGEGQQVGDDLRRALGLAVDGLDLGAGGLVEVLEEQKLGEAHDAGEGVVELVGDAGDELADTGHLLGLEEALLDELGLWCADPRPPRRRERRRRPWRRRGGAARW